jgi:hypothetical protein
VHRFLIAGVCAGSKAQCDVFCTNAHYAKVGGIKVQELNALEREFLRVTQWALCVSPSSVYAGRVWLSNGELQLEVMVEREFYICAVSITGTLWDLVHGQFLGAYRQ